MRYLYSVWCILTFVTTFLALFPVFVLLSLFGNGGRKAIWAVIRGWSFVWFFMIGMIVKIKYHGGKFDKSRNYIVVANHASYIDVPFIFRAVPFFVRPLAKAELAKIPLFGFLYRQVAILVDRSDNKSKAHSVQKLRRALNREGSIFIFPEGTFNETTEAMKPFYDGAFRLALQTNTPILPVIFPDAVNRWHYKGIFHWSPGQITAIFLPPVEVETFKNNMSGLKQKVFDIMKEEMIEARS
ncbi:1-acyl-sn-glycerol-3-phosphate acyltransferase [Taibaiella lutea]|uniref:1-acyl-sn-glycerol-3-phosphate acyltransferase n=1 Tax=Taibaiella lutea TaxID=2608001 RepID=A0A5M6CPB4_9BACT|nr:lysophospholipid acyltransferase family protein [Taibaiella lutea]KAA5537088.1 1-acyl-sn-glycerol-3-phosphate acyltransferase [Taibaiella lutea]